MLPHGSPLLLARTAAAAASRLTCAPSDCRDHCCCSGCCCRQLPPVASGVLVICCTRLSWSFICWLLRNLSAAVGRRPAATLWAGLLEKPAANSLQQSRGVGMSAHVGLGCMQRKSAVIDSVQQRRWQWRRSGRVTCAPLWRCGGHHRPQAHQRSASHCAPAAGAWLQEPQAANMRWLRAGRLLRPKAATCASYSRLQSGVHASSQHSPWAAICSPTRNRGQHRPDYTVVLPDGLRKTHRALAPSAVLYLLGGTAEAACSRLQARDQPTPCTSTIGA